jgi:hypothetical protein
MRCEIWRLTVSPQKTEKTAWRAMVPVCLTLGSRGAGGHRPRADFNLMGSITSLAGRAVADRRAGSRWKVSVPDGPAVVIATTRVPPQPVAVIFPCTTTARSCRLYAAVRCILDSTTTLFSSAKPAQVLTQGAWFIANLTLRD